MQNPSDSLTVLEHSMALATKRWYLGPNDQVLVEDYGKGKRFTCHVVPCSTFDEMAAWLASLVDEPRAFVIRGEPIPGQDLTDILRRCKPKDGEPPGFREVPRRWLMVDCDQALTREDVQDLDLSRPDDCEKGINRLLATLPIEMRQASCFWQLSSSAGFKPGVRAHLWFWLDRPMGERELTRWAENVNDSAGRRLVDPAVFRTVQPNYTSNPLIDVGVTDPVGKRWGILKGVDELRLPKMAERAGAWMRKLDVLRNPRTLETHPHLRDAAASFFLSKGADADSSELLKAMRRAVDSAHAMRGDGETIYTDDKLTDYIDSGRSWAAEKGATAENLVAGQDGKVRPTIGNARAILAGSPEWSGVLGKNERLDKVMALAKPPFGEDYSGPIENYPRPWTDADDRRLSVWFQACKREMICGSQLSREAVDVVAAQTTYDPIRDYMLSLSWDGTARIDTWLIDLCGVDDSRYTRKIGAMWLIQAVARTLQPGCKADGVLVLEGSQGKKKSSFLRDLAGGLEYFLEGIGDIYQKDTLLAMAAAFIVELRENPGISGREVEAYKAFIDRQIDRYRSPYGARPEDHPRRCVLAATTNLQAYLRDDTGARRWWPVLVKFCDLEALAEVRDQLWAEAVHRYRAGEQWWVDAEDPDFVREQESRFDADSREELLRDALENGCCRPHISPSDKHVCAGIPVQCKAVTVTQILYHHWQLPLKEHDKKNQMAVTSMLKRLGWERRSDGKDRFWVKRGGQVVSEVVSSKNS